MNNLLCLSAIVFFFLACQKERAHYVELAGKAQGTTFSIKYTDHRQRDFSGSVDSILRLIDKSMSLWDSISVISRVNRNEYADIDAHFENVFNQSRKIFINTEGAFDPTVGPLVRAWGFSFKKGMPPPDSIMVDSLKKIAGFEKIKLQDGAIIKTNPSIEIDFNAIAQGYTVDLISSFLEEKAIDNYLVEIGGEVRARGVNERDSVWVIGIDKPVENNKGRRALQTTVALRNKSLATSGSYRKFIERNGKKFSHVIDPSTGFPVSHNMLSVSVIAADCASADAYATAFLVMGMDKAFEKALEIDLEIYCIYAHDNGKISIRSTPDFGK